MASSTLYILYNADASIMGKLKYSYRKICKSSEDNPACAACDITHGGLSLQETPQWVETKKVIEAESGCKIVQWHRDELSAELKRFVVDHNVKYPVVIASKEGSFVEVMSASDLAACKGDAGGLVAGLREKGFMQEKPAAPAL